MSDAAPKEPLWLLLVKAGGAFIASAVILLFLIIIGGIFLSVLGVI